MAQCPLSPGGHDIHGLAEVCREQCADIWDTAIRTTAGEVDFYGVADGECRHGRHGIENSHDALQALGHSATRLFVLVDMCQGCGEELFETSWSFICPFNEEESSPIEAIEEHGE
jgi:hypothetical protein